MVLVLIVVLVKDDNPIWLEKQNYLKEKIIDQFLHYYCYYTTYIVGIIVGTPSIRNVK